MKNNTEVFPEDFKLTRKKMRMIQAFIDDFINGESYRYDREPIPPIPTPLEFANFIRKRAVFLKNIECFYGIETNHKGIWIGVFFNYKDTTLKGYTGLDYDDLPYVGEYIEVNLKGLVKAPIWKQQK